MIWSVGQGDHGSPHPTNSRHIMTSSCKLYMGYVFEYLYCKNGNTRINLAELPLKLIIADIAKPHPGLGRKKNMERFTNLRVILAQGPC